METDKLARATTLLLSFTAGFCDTLTFVAGAEIFSAHVTGNFIVFAYHLAKHTDTHGWQKMLTFPVFILAVMLGGHIANKRNNMYTLLVLEGLLLTLSGLLSAVWLNQAAAGNWQVQLTVMLMVIAMAFQNTFGKLHGKATYGLTTVMTGNVTQASLDLMNGLIAAPPAAEVWISFKKQVILIAGFLTGCIAGAVMAKLYGLVPAVLPGIIMLVWLGGNGVFVRKATK